MADSAANNEFTGQILSGRIRHKAHSHNVDGPSSLGPVIIDDYGDLSPGQMLKIREIYPRLVNDPRLHIIGTPHE